MPDDEANEIGLRPWSADDLDLMTRLLGDPAMTEHLGGPETPEQLQRRLDRYLAMTPAAGRMFVITLGRERVPVGSVGYWPHEPGVESDLETGWSVLPEFQGRGVATRGTDQCLDIAAAEGGYRSIHAYPSIENAASNALCRTLGFELLGQSDFEYPAGHWMTCNDWSLDLEARGLRLARIGDGAVDRSRATLKAAIPQEGAHGIPLRDELEVEMPIGAPGAPATSDAEALLALELALARRDASAISGGYEAVLAPEFIEIGASGRRWTRDEILEALRAAPPNGSIAIEAFDLTRLAPGIVIATFDLAAAGADGVPTRSRRSSTWIRRDGRWMMRFHQGTPLPAGRDRSHERRPG